jgi:hypothetical protein
MHHTLFRRAAGLDLLIACALYPVRAGHVWSQSSLNCPQIKHVSLLSSHERTRTAMAQLAEGALATLAQARTHRCFSHP